MDEKMDENRGEENSKKSPWHIPSSTNFSVSSLNTIMYEEKAKVIQEREDKIIAHELHEKLNDLPSSELIEERDTIPNFGENDPENNEECDSDYLLAKLLQNEFDAEENEILMKTEKKLNGSSKVSISFSNYRLPSTDTSLSSEDEEEDEPIQHWDRFVSTEQTYRAIPKCGYLKKEGSLVTKHDMALSGSRNACKILDFPPEFQTGDGEDFDMKLPNKVFNSLRIHSRNTQKQSHRLDDKTEHATSDVSLNTRTRMLLYRLINKGILECVNSIISTGKESIVFHAEGGTDKEGNSLPKNCAVKVFKTVISDFKNRGQYIEGDFRFKGKYNKKNSTNLLNIWAEKEKNNLLRMQKANIMCPDALLLCKHILVLSFIGHDNIPALQLKHAVLDSDQTRRAYRQIYQTMKDMYNKANLVHADLSEYNILWHEGNCWFIDVGQAVEKTHPNANTFLKRDCKNINNFFRKLNFDTMSDDFLYSYVTNEDHTTDEQYMNPLQNFEKNLENLTLQDPDPEKIYPFDYYWEKSQQG